MAETTRRIVAASVQIHAERGGTATTHAEAAQRAGVAVPTVYKHFPTRAALVGACLAEVSRAAPRIDERVILEQPDFDLRMGRLVDAVYGQHAYYAPWWRWMAVDAPQLPELAAAVAASEERLDALIRGTLAPAFNGKVPRPPLAVAKVLLGFASWQELTRMLHEPGLVSRTATGALRMLFSRLPVKRPPP